MLCEDNEGSDKILVIRKQKIHLGSFKCDAITHIYKLRKMFEQLPDNGLKEEDCQRVCLLNRLKSLWQAVNSLEQGDLLECQVEFYEER